MTLGDLVFTFLFIKPSDLLALAVTHSKTPCDIQTHLIQYVEHYGAVVKQWTPDREVKLWFNSHERKVLCP